MVFFLVKQKAIDKEDTLVYIYGTEVLLSTIFNMLIILGIAFYTGNYAQILFFIVPFLFLRMTIGGYHAKTHIGCAMLMTITILTYIYLVRYMQLYFNAYLTLFSVIISFVLMYKFTPVEHPNKRLLPEDYARAKKNTIIVCSVLIGFMTYFVIAREVYLLIYMSLGVISSAVAMLIGKVAYTKTPIK